VSSFAAVIIDTYGKSEFAKRALNETCKCRAISSVHTFSINPIFPGEVFHCIRSINSSVEYSDFVINVLPYFVTEQYALIIQWDGFVINPECWTNDFFGYDFIGSPWPDMRSEDSVGNGGFSLRSNSFLNHSKNLRVIPDNSSYINKAEDTILCQTYRKELISKGLRFAPQEVADNFAYETIYREQTFGFHGAHNLPNYVPESFLIDNISEILMRVSNNAILTSIVLTSLHSQKLDFVTELVNEIRFRSHRGDAVRLELIRRGMFEVANLFI
jgi:hypothetical protein